LPQRNTNTCLTGSESVRKFILSSHCSMFAKGAIWRCKQYGPRLVVELWHDSSLRIESTSRMTWMLSVTKALHTNRILENQTIHILSN